MSKPWFRLYHEFATDPKIQSMSETLQRRYIMLLCLKCNGDLSTCNDDELSFALHIPLEELHKTKEIFISKKFIDEDWNILNWDKRQYVSDSSKERVKKCREKKKEKCPEDVTLQERYNAVTVTPPDTDTDTDSDTDSDTEDLSFTRSTNVDPVVVRSRVQPDHEEDLRKSKKPKTPPCPHQKILDLYHTELPMCPNVLVLSKTRKNYVSARWKEWPDLEFFEQFFKKVSLSKFLTGKITPTDKNRKPFLADFCWLMRPENFAKVIEGRYNG